MAIIRLTLTFSQSQSLTLKSIFKNITFSGRKYLIVLTFSSILNLPKARCLVVVMLRLCPNNGYSV